MPPFSSVPSPAPWDHSEIFILQKIARQNKLKLFLVGGFLRDQHLARVTRDFDFAVSGGAIGLARKFARSIKGAFVLLDKENGCARVAKKRPDGLWTYDFADLRAKTLKGDLIRRDFTINTLTLDVAMLAPGKPWDNDVQDHLFARRDMKLKVIRMAGKNVFKDDPLRLLRAYSLKAQLGFKIEETTHARIIAAAPLIKTVSPERVREELFKVLSSPRAAATVRAMDRDRMLPAVIPQLRVMHGVSQGGYHHLDVWRHSLEALAQLDKLLLEFKDDADVEDYLAEELGGGHNRLAVLKFACLLHDIGKPDTKKKEPGGRTSFHTHEHAGRRIGRIIAKQLMLSTHERYALEDMITHHLRPGYLSNFKRPSDKAVFRYFRDTKAEAASIALLSIADQRATRGPLTTDHDLKHHQEIGLGLIRKFFVRKKEKPFVRLLTGHDLIRELGLKPGPLFATILGKVEEAQHLGKVATKEEALAFARKAVQS